MTILPPREGTSMPDMKERAMENDVCGVYMCMELVSASFEAAGGFPTIKNGL